MATSSYGAAQQRASANTATRDDGPALRCAASGCPNSWSVSVAGGRGLCSAHAWAHPSTWSNITQHQQWAQTERARAQANEYPDTPADGVALKANPAALARAMALVMHENSPATSAQRAVDNVLRIAAERGHMSASQRAFVLTCRRMLRDDDPRQGDLDFWLRDPVNEQEVEA